VLADSSLPPSPPSPRGPSGPRSLRSSTSATTSERHHSRPVSRRRTYIYETFRRDRSGQSNPRERAASTRVDLVGSHEPWRNLTSDGGAMADPPRPDCYVAQGHRHSSVKSSTSGIAARCTRHLVRSAIRPPPSRAARGLRPQRVLRSGASVRAPDVYGHGQLSPVLLRGLARAAGRRAARRRRAIRRARVGRHLSVTGHQIRHRCC
jgi:hypothetical protein